MEQKEPLYDMGVEREALRCTENGDLSKLPHPKLFGDRMKNNFITTDWGEAQIEIRTPVCKNNMECYKKLEEITNVVMAELKNNNEFLWPYSMPCNLPAEEDFIVGNYGDGKKGKEEFEYDKLLHKKYGYKMHCISGIHINFSLREKLLTKIREVYKNVPENSDDVYCKIMKNFMNRAWMLMYFLGATPVQIENNITRALSLRNTKEFGFTNKETLYLDFSSKKNYIESIEKILNSGKVLGAREIYTPIRPKTSNKSNMIQELKEQKIKYIEVRLCDVNPFDKCGISKNDLDFLVIFLINCLIDDNDISFNYQEIAEIGVNEKQHQILLREFEKYRKINNEFELDCEDGIEEMYIRCKDNKTKANEIMHIVEKEGLKNGMLNLAKNYMNQAYQERYTIKSYPALETSTMTLIKDAITQGIDYNIINEEKSFIELINGDKHEYIIQATKTRKDSYIFPYITDDKYFAKEIMKQNGVCVPEGIMINKKMAEEQQEKLISQFDGKPVVIKPRTTNCGVGITVFEKLATRKELKKAVKYAFKFDNDILLEECIQGKEYRFLVIDGKCLSVVWRRSASVIGDGKSTIRELIEEKQKEPWHYLLRKQVKVDEPMEEFLALQGYTLDYIPLKDERVYLRKNSNVSTGGESVDVTEMMPQHFKNIAEKTAKVFNSKICGIDIIIDDILKEEYTMIEINDNPGISINEWPYEGKGRKIGLDILKSLEMI